MSVPLSCASQVTTPSSTKDQDGSQDGDPARARERTGTSGRGGVVGIAAAIAKIEEQANGWPDLWQLRRPRVLQVAAQCVQAHDEDTVATVLDVLYDLAYSPSTAVASQLNEMVRFALMCMADSNLRWAFVTRPPLSLPPWPRRNPSRWERGTFDLHHSDTLFLLIENSPESAAGALLESNPAWKEDMNLEDATDEPTETSMAQGTLDMLACEIPKKYIFNQSCRGALLDCPPAKHPHARPVLLDWVLLPKGAPSLFENTCTMLCPTSSAAGDGDAQVRECACFALVCKQLLAMFSKFCERLEPDAVRPLLDPLVRKLAAMLEATTKRSVQEMAVAALAATAVAAEEEFTPYVGGVAALMTKLMALQEERLYSLRGRALECMGHMAVLLENKPSVMGEEFAPVLPDLVPHLIKVIGANEGHMEKADGEDKCSGDQFNNLDDSDDEEDEDGAGYVLHVRTALLEAKKGAITAIGEMAAHTGSAFVPHLEEVMEVLSEAGRTHWHPLVKCEVAEALPSMVIPSVAAYHNGEISWKRVTRRNPCRSIPPLLLLLSLLS
ncbi:Vacuolar 14 Fab1-binding region [Fragilaria crotonensis]|nr:Vacuolar 14 Fab1-binding region [Fragilaria crotonensis]